MLQSGSELGLTDLRARLKDYKKLRTETGRPNDYSECESRTGRAACLHMLDYLSVTVYLM